MPMKKRKSLDDALAQEFVYGENEASNQPSSIKPGTIEQTQPEVVEKTKKTQQAVTSPSLPRTQEKQTKKKKSKLSIMDKLQPVEQREATKRFTVDLPDSMHRKLSILAAKTGRTKADIVRTLLEDVLQEVNE